MNRWKDSHSLPVNCPEPYFTVCEGYLVNIEPSGTVEGRISQRHWESPGSSVWGYADVKSELQSRCWNFLRVIVINKERNALSQKSYLYQQEVRLSSTIQVWKFWGMNAPSSHWVAGFPTPTLAVYDTYNEVMIQYL